MANHVYRGAQALHVSTPALRVRNFTKMKPPVHYGSNVKGDPQDFIGEVYKLLTIMGVSLENEAKLATHQLKGLAHIWFP